MFSNIHQKIKKAAIAYFWVLTIISVIDGIYFATNYFLATVFLIIMPIFNYITSLFMYSVGELVENTKATRDLLQEIKDFETTSPEEKEKKAISDALKF